MSLNPVHHHSYMKHIAVDLHFVCDYVAKGLLNICHVSSHDRLTEAHTRSLLEMLRSKIGITDGETILQGHDVKGIS